MEEVKRWKPRMFQVYYTPAPNREEAFYEHFWASDRTDYILYHRGMVCQTQDEAIEKAQLMLKALEESCKNN